MDKTIITTEKELHATVQKAITDAMIAAERAKPEKLYNFSQVARKLEVDRRSVVRMVKTGRITATADGRYITQAELDRYLNTKTTRK